MKHCAGVKFPTLTTASAEDKWPHLCLGGSGTSAASSSISWPVRGTLAVTRGGMAQLETWHHAYFMMLMASTQQPQAGWLLELINGVDTYIVKLRQGSGKDRQGMALKAKGLKA